MFSRRAFSLAAAVALAAAGACKEDPTGVDEIDAPRQIQECETWTARVCGIWTLNGDHYDAVWSDGSQATIHIVKFTATRAMFVREDLTGKSAGMTAWYDGAVTDGRVVEGRVTWRKDDFEWGNTWEAEWEE